jgi:hypothetical protein
VVEDLAGEIDIELVFGSIVDERSQWRNKNGAIIGGPFTMITCRDITKPGKAEVV